MITNCVFLISRRRVRNYKTIWFLQGDEWPETNCYLGTVFFMFHSLSADKSLYNYSLFRVGWSTNKQENKAGRSTRLFLIILSCSQVQEKSRGVWDICLGPAQIQPDQATASRDSAEPEPGDTWWWCQQPKPQREDHIGRQLSDPGGFQDYYEQCKTLASSPFIFFFPDSPSPHETGSFLGDDKWEENPFEMNEHYQDMRT